MRIEPIVLSFWQEKEKKNFLCSGVLVSGKHVLTVAHAFKNLHKGGHSFVALVPGKDKVIPLALVERHSELDASIFEFGIELTAIPFLDMSGEFEDCSGRPVCLHVVDPKTHDRARTVSYSVSHYDGVHREYVITPESAKGYSGGVVESDGRVLGMLNRRVRGQPLARAISMAALRPWIAWVLDPPAGSRPATKTLLTSSGRCLGMRFSANLPIKIRQAFGGDSDFLAKSRPWLPSRG